MSVRKSFDRVPVLLLYNIDHSWESAEIDQALQETAVFETAIRNYGYPLTSLPIHDADLVQRLQGYDPDQYVVFNWCEEVPGIPQSEVLAAQTLETLHFTYTGSPPDVLKFCWDKLQVKQMLDIREISTPRWRVCHTDNIDGWNYFPAIVKPSREHCSLGVTTDAVVTSPQEMRTRISFIIDTFRQPALVEDFIDGREFHVTVWGNDPIEMLPPAEMDFLAFEQVRDRVCTYESKFRPGSRHYEGIDLRIPASLSDMEYERLKWTSTMAYRAVGCRDYARLDIRLRDGIFYVLDINPNSDISAETSTAYAAEAAGYPYGEMIGRIIRFATQRHPVFKK